MADPKYVRLSERMATSTIADIAGGSQWSISGMDVKEFPKDNDAAKRFVRNRLTAGVLEPAGKAEFDEVQSTNKRMAEVASSAQQTAPAAPVASTGIQEAQVQQQAQEEAQKLAESRKKRDDKKKEDEDS